MLRPGDLLFKVAGFPGPLAVGRKGRDWPSEDVREAAALVASYSPKACRSAQEGFPVSVNASADGHSVRIEVFPSRETRFSEPSWEEAREELYALRKPGKSGGD